MARLDRLSPVLFIQLLLDSIMIPLNPIRPTTHREQVVRDADIPRKLTRQYPHEQRFPSPDLLEAVSNCCETLRACTAAIFSSANVVLLLENELVRFLYPDQCPFGQIIVRRERDFLHPLVAELEREFGVFVHAAAAGVGLALLSQVTSLSEVKQRVSQNNLTKLFELVAKSQTTSHS